MLEDFTSHIFSGANKVTEKLHDERTSLKINSITFMAVNSGRSPYSKEWQTVILCRNLLKH